MPVDSRPSPVHDDRLSPGTRIQDLVVEQWVRAVPDGHHYRVVNASTGRGATLHEYLPRAWCQRQDDGVRALPGHGQDFQAGMRRFMMKARQLRTLEHPALPLLLDTWSSHGTAYALLSPLPAQTLAEVVAAQGGRLRLAQAWPWMCACFEFAEWLHRQGKIHGAWDPESIWVQEDQRLLMAAPEVDGGVRLASPWVALEQTAQAPSGIKCGPWTDVFGIAAIAAFMLTGQSPATARRLPLAAWMPPAPPGTAARKPSGEPPPRALLAAIRVSLLPNPRQRPQDIAQLKAMMGLGPQLPVLQDGDSLPPEAPDSILGGDTVPMHELPDTALPQPARAIAAAAAAASAAQAAIGAPPVVAPPVVPIPLSEAETEPIPLMAEPAPPVHPGVAAAVRPRRSPSVFVLAGLALVAVLVGWLALRPEPGADPLAQRPPAATPDKALDRLLESAPPAAGPGVVAAPAAAPGAVAAPAAAPGAVAVPAAAPGPVASSVAGGGPGQPRPANAAAAAQAATGDAGRGGPAAAGSGPVAGSPVARAVAGAAAASPQESTSAGASPASPPTTAKPGAEGAPATAAGRRLSRCSQALIEKSLGGAAGGAAYPKDCP